MLVGPGGHLKGAVFRKWSSFQKGGFLQGVRGCILERGGQMVEKASNTKVKGLKLTKQEYLDTMKQLERNLHSLAKGT